jgi:hypothetical protein
MKSEIWVLEHKVDEDFPDEHLPDEYFPNQMQALFCSNTRGDTIRKLSNNEIRQMIAISLDNLHAEGNHSFDNIRIPKKWRP